MFKFLAHLSGRLTGERIGWIELCCLSVHPLSVCPSSTLFKHLLRNHLAGQSQITYGARLKILKHSMQHQMLKYYQVYSNDDPGLTLTYFTARSNLVPDGFVWEKGKTMDFSEFLSFMN